MAYFLTISTSESQNPGGNSSTVSANLFLNSNNGSSWWGTTVSGNINIGGNVSGFSRTSGGSASGSWSALVHSYSVTYSHDANGYRGPVGISGAFGPGSNVPSLSVSGGTYGAIDYVRLPSAPSSVNAVATGPTVVVTSGEASTPGPTITAYKVSYRESTNGGVTWGAWTSEVNMTSRAYTYTLTPGRTYQFRVRAQNTDGFGAYTESGTLFLTAGGKRWTGDNWALTVAQAKRFNGTSWVDLTIAKRYDGAQWVNLS